MTSSKCNLWALVGNLIIFVSHGLSRSSAFLRLVGKDSVSSRPNVRASPSSQSRGQVDGRDSSGLALSARSAEPAPSLTKYVRLSQSLWMDFPRRRRATASLRVSESKIVWSAAPPSRAARKEHMIEIFMARGLDYAARRERLRYEHGANFDTATARRALPMVTNP